MSAIMCSAVLMVGGAYESWQNFKLLKRRERINSEIAVCSDSEEVLNLLVEAREAQNEVREVLKFWTVYAFLAIFELYIEIFVFWLPFYYSFKFLLVVWIVLARGAGSIFHNVLEPELDRRAIYIDNVASPAVQGVVLTCQRRILNALVAASTFVASDDQLADLQDHLGSLQKRIDNEQKSRLESVNENDSQIARAIHNARHQNQHQQQETDADHILSHHHHHHANNNHVEVSSAEISEQNNNILWSLAGSTAGYLYGFLQRNPSSCEGTTQVHNHEHPHEHQHDHQHEHKHEQKVQQQEHGREHRRSSHDRPGHARKDSESSTEALSFAGSRGATHRNSKKSTSTARDRSQRPSGVNIVHGVELDVSTGRESRSGSTSWVKSAFDGVLGLTVGTRDILMGTSPNSANSQHREVKVPEVDFYEENKGDESSPRNHSGTRKSKRKDDLLSKYRQGFEDLSDLDDSDDSARPPARFERPMTRSQARKK